MKKLLILGIVALCAVSCVSNKTFNSMKAEALRLDGALASANIRIDEINARNKKLAEDNSQLIADSARRGADYLYLNQKYKKLLSDGSAEAARMLREIESTQGQLRDRAERVEELEQLLRAREESIAAIRRKVADALLGFEGKGLSISTREGKVYVSMDDKLLFRSGSFEIDPKGAAAVKELATVLAQNADINVMVEGHTDDVPYGGSGNLKDNLDLSAKRATTVVRLLLSNKQITPSRIIAAGRGESLPVAEGKSSDSRAKNRRTEIILTPKLDELMRLMDQK